MKLATLTSLFTLAATSALAHPGHDTALRDGASHWVFSPQHGLGLVAIAAVLLVVHAARRKE